MHRSSQRDNQIILYFKQPCILQGCFLFKCVVVYDYLLAPAGPRSTAAVVSAKNMPQAYFLNASTVLKEIIAYRCILYLSASHKMRGCFFCLQCVFDYLFAPAGPRSTAAAVSAENMPQACFLNASTVLKE